MVAVACLLVNGAGVRECQMVRVEEAMGDLEIEAGDGNCCCIEIPSSDLQLRLLNAAACAKKPDCHGLILCSRRFAKSLPGCANYQTLSALTSPTKIYRHCQRR